MPNPTTVCSQAIGGLMARFTRLDECCGPPVAGTPCSVATSKFISLTLDPDIEDATEFTQKLADDTLCINEEGCPQLKGFDMTLQLCQYDPELLEMIVGADLYTDFAGNVKGVFMREDFGACPKFALEVWARGPRSACVPGQAGGVFQYFLFPCVSAGAITGGFNFNNEVQTIEITAKAKSSSEWGVGPYGVDEGDALVPPTPAVLQTPISVAQPMVTFPTLIAPPTALCGCVAMPAAP